jgi:hypothetical protein
MEEKLAFAASKDLLHEISPTFRSATPLQISNFWRHWKLLIFLHHFLLFKSIFFPDVTQTRVFGWQMVSLVTTKLFLKHLVSIAQVVSLSQGQFLLQ